MGASLRTRSYAPGAISHVPLWRLCAQWGRHGHKMYALGTTSYEMQRLAENGGRHAQECMHWVLYCLCCGNRAENSGRRGQNSVPCLPYCMISNSSHGKWEQACTQVCMHLVAYCVYCHKAAENWAHMRTAECTLCDILYVCTYVCSM